MQQFLLIPEIPVIVRKIAPDGCHTTYWDDSDRDRERAQYWVERLQADPNTRGLSWTLDNLHNPDRTINLSFLENSNAR